MAKQTYVSLRKNENCPILRVCPMCARITFVSLRKKKMYGKENALSSGWENLKILKIGRSPHYAIPGHTYRH
jgi:hypothetical protein